MFSFHFIDSEHKVPAAASYPIYNIPTFSNIKGVNFLNYDSLDLKTFLISAYYHMMELDSRQAISANEELMKSLTKQIYYKRTDAINSLINENRDQINFIGLINQEKMNTCT